MESIDQLYDRLQPGVPTRLPEYGGVIATRAPSPCHVVGDACTGHGLPSDAPGTTVVLDERDLAVAMHRHLCHGNHMDQCGWEYEILAGVHQWNGYAHRNWLARARVLQGRIPDVSIPDIITVLGAL